MSQLSPPLPPVPSASRSPQTVPSWQPDDTVSECPLCTKAFGWWTRRHHCRKCGRVVCSSCASNFYAIPSTQIVRTPHDSMRAFAIGLDSNSNSEAQTEEVRTCDGCFSRLEQDRCRRMLGLDISSLDPRVAAQIIRESVISPAVLGSPPPSYSRLSILNNQRAAENIPGQGLDGSRQGRIRASSSLLGAGMHGRGRRRRSHADEDGTGSSSVPHRASHLHGHGQDSLPLSRPVPDAVPLRYVAFELTDSDKMVGDECPICFEEYQTGQVIARLECWCVFHVHCIKAWKNQRAGTGGCPLHFHD